MKRMDSPLIGKRSRGFSLMGILAGVAGMSVLALGLLEIAKLSSSINAMANESNEIQNQLYVSKILLSDEATCRLNFVDVAFPNERARLNRNLYQKNASGPGLSGNSIFPTGGINVVDAFFIKPIPGVSTAVFIDVEFRRNLIFGVGQTLVRSFPLQVQVGGGLITNCTTGDRLSPSDGSGSGSDSDGLPSLAKFGNCDDSGLPINSFLPGGSSDLNSSKHIEAGRSDLCSKLSYPFETGTLDCGMSGLSHSSKVFAERYGYHCVGAFTVRPSSTSKRLAGLKSREDCMKLPIYPMGTELTVSGLGSPTGIGPSSRKITCVNGAWSVER